MEQTLYALTCPYWSSWKTKPLILEEQRGNFGLGEEQGDLQLWPQAPQPSQELRTHAGLWIHPWEAKKWGKYFCEFCTAFLLFSK